MWLVWLVFCDCVFILSIRGWIRTRGLWKLPDGWDWLWGKLGLVLMGGAMLSKSLIQFSVDGWGCVPSLLFGQTMVEIMKIMVTSFKKSHACTVVCNPASLACYSPWGRKESVTTEQLNWTECFQFLNRVFLMNRCILI